MIRHRWLWFFLTALCQVFLSTEAAARDAIDVDFNTAAGDMPGYVCVITARGTPPQVAKDKSEVYSSIPLSMIERSLDPSTGAFQRPFALWADAPGGVGMGKPVKPIERSLAAVFGQVGASLLARGDDSSDCEADFDACAPKLSLRSAVASFASAAKSDADQTPLFVSCQRNEALREENGSVVFLAVRLIRGLDLPIARISLYGSAASLHFTGEIGSEESAALRVVGGHYAEGRSVLTIGDRATVPLIPRCKPATVRVPDVNLIGATLQEVTLSANGQPVRSCIPSRPGSLFVIKIPHRDAPARYELVASAAGSMLAASWFGIDPPTDALLRLKAFTVSWERDCTYHGACPTLSVDGISCPHDEAPSEPEETEPSANCRYTCRTTGSFSLPASAHFTAADGVEHWDEKITYPGQDMHGYIDPDRRKLRIDLSAWTGLPIYERTRITGVQIDLPSGERHLLDLRHKLFDLSQKGSDSVVIEDEELRTPNLPCGVPIRYQIVAPHQPDIFKDDVEDGAVKIRSPKCSGFSCTRFRSALRLGALGRDRQGQIPPSEFGRGFYVGADFLGVFEPWDSAFYTDFGYSALLGNREYVKATEGSTTITDAPYGRLAYRFALGLRTPPLPPVLPALALGLGMEAGYGHVLNFGESAEVRGDFFASPFVIVTIGRVAGVVRMLWGEELVEIVPSTAARKADHKVTYFGYELQYQFDLSSINSR